MDSSLSYMCMREQGLNQSSHFFKHSHRIYRLALPRVVDRKKIRGGGFDQSTSVVFLTTSKILYLRKEGSLPFWLDPGLLLHAQEMLSLLSKSSISLLNAHLYGRTQHIS